MIINHVDRWAYVGINKNGSTSLHEYLKQPPLWGFDPEPCRQHRDELPDGAEDYRVLVIARNPFARALSLWRHALYEDMTGVSFAEFLERCVDHPDPFYSRRQVDYLNAGDIVTARIETLTYDLAAFFDNWDLPPVPHLNATDSRAFRGLYTPEAIAFVRDRYREDFERFGYSPYLLSGVSVPHTCTKCCNSSLLVDASHMWCPACDADPLS